MSHFVWRNGLISNIIVRWTSHIYEETCIQGFGGETERKKPLWTTWTYWEVDMKWVLKKQGGRMWTGFVWLRIGTSVRRFLWRWRWTFGPVKMWGISLTFRGSVYVLKKGFAACSYFYVLSRWHRNLGDEGCWHTWYPHHDFIYAFHTTNWQHGELQCDD
jgi:hypothetical protein